jgi:hypothetical protein
LVGPPHQVPPLDLVGPPHVARWIPQSPSASAVHDPGLDLQGDQRRPLRHRKAVPDSLGLPIDR